MTSRIATPSDIQGMMDLQSKNLFTSLSEEDRKMGFVTTPFSEDQILNSINSAGLFVTEIENKIAAYAFAGTWEYFEQWPIFPYMTSRFKLLSYGDFNITTEDTFQYGPVCVDRMYRGKGVFNMVFEAMRLKWMKKYPLSITFINAVNEISVRGHEKLGWEVIDHFQFNGNQYLGLAFDMKYSVL
jgi:hypothetical protein